MHMTENIEFSIFQFYLYFFTKVGYRGFKSRCRSFWKLLPSRFHRVPNTTGEFPNGMRGTVLNLGASGHLLDYVIDNLLMRLGLLWRILAAL